MIPSRSFLASALGLLASIALPSLVSAQMKSECNPLEKDCPANPAFSISHEWAFNTTPPGWEAKPGPVTYTPEDGATFTIKAQGDSPTLRSKYYIFFGRVELMMKTAPGRGIISSVMLFSDDKDEIDWEILGANNTHVSTNYFGKGREDFTKGGYHPVSGLSTEWHNYTVVWTKDRLQWFIDTQMVRELLPNDANSTQNYPQTPARLYIGIWAGGDPRLAEGTRQWAGGDTDYNAGPYSMHVKDVKIQDFSSGKEYVYGTENGVKTGTWQSIQVVAGESTANETVHEVPDGPSPSISERFNALSPGAKAGIFGGVGGAIVLIAIALLVYFFKQRRRGAAEAKLAEDRQNQERMELEQFKKAGINPDSLTVHQSEYNAEDMRGKDDYSSVSAVPVDPAGPLSEKSWGGSNPAAGAGLAAAGMAGAAGAMRSPAPLLRNDGSRSPSPQSPGFGGGAYHDDVGRGGFGGPQSPGSPHSPGPHHDAQRSYTAPMPQMGSPGPQTGAYGMPRLNSPGPMGPQRSFSNDPYQGHGGHGGGDGYWR